MFFSLRLPPALLANSPLAFFGFNESHVFTFFTDLEIQLGALEIVASDMNLIMDTMETIFPFGYTDLSELTVFNTINLIQSMDKKVPLQEQDYWLIEKKLEPKSTQKWSNE